MLAKEVVESTSGTESRAVEMVGLELEPNKEGELLTDASIEQAPAQLKEEVAPVEQPPVEIN